MAPTRFRESEQWRTAGPGLAEYQKLRDSYYGNVTITQPFGPSTLPGEPAYAGYPHFHMGTDLVFGSPNGIPTAAPVRAPASGRVVQAGWNRGFGNSVTIKSPNGFTTLLGHMSSLQYNQKHNGFGPDLQSPSTAVGDRVYAGEIVGFMGSTGYSTGPHTHVEVRDPAGKPQDLGRNNGQVLGSLSHGLGWGGGYLPGHYGAAPDPDNFMGSPFQVPVPEPLQTGSNWNPLDPRDPYNGSPLPTPDPISGTPISVNPVTGQPVSNPTSGDPFGYGNPILGAFTGSIEGIAVFFVGAVLLIIGLIGLIRQTDSGQAATNAVVNVVKDSALAAA